MGWIPRSRSPKGARIQIENEDSTAGEESLDLLGRPFLMFSAASRIVDPRATRGTRRRIHFSRERILACPGGQRPLLPSRHSPDTGRFLRFFAPSETVHLGEGARPMTKVHARYARQNFFSLLSSTSTQFSIFFGRFFFLSLLFVLDFRRIILEDRLKFPVVIGIIEEVVRRIFNFFFFCNLTLENVNGVLVASRHETLLANANIRRVFLRSTRKILYFEKYYRVLSLSPVKISYISIVLTIFLYTKTRFLSLRKFRKIRKNVRQ